MGSCNLIICCYLNLTVLQEHFESLTSANFGLKEESVIKIMKEKIRNAKQLLVFLVDNTGLSLLTDIISHIDLLGHKETGFFAVNPKANASTNIAHLQEFLNFAATIQVLSTEESRRANLKLGFLSKNLQKLSKARKARVKEEERSKQITEEDIKNFYDSEYAVECRKLLAQKPDIIEVRPRTVTKLRNYLLFLLIEQNMLREEPHLLPSHLSMIKVCIKQQRKLAE